MKKIHKLPYLVWMNHFKKDIFCCFLQRLTVRLTDTYLFFFMYSLLKWKVKNCPDLVVSAFERLTCYVFLYWEKQCWLHNTIRTFLLIIGDGMGWHSVDELHVLYCSIAGSDYFFEVYIFWCSVVSNILRMSQYRVFKHIRMFKYCLILR